LTWLGVLPVPITIVLAIGLVAAPAVAYRLGLRPLGVVRLIPLGRLLGAERWERVGDWLSRVDGAVAGLVGDPRHLITFVVLSGGIFAVYAAQLLLVGRAFGIVVDPFAAWGALGLATMVGVLSLLPFGLGSADLALVALLGVAGVPTVEAVAITLGYRVVSTLPLSIAGIVSFAWLSARLPASGMGGAARAVKAELGDGIPDFAVDP
jgi:uncharacterized membrane protein YbhN (UPF0104 family)